MQYYQPRDSLTFSSALEKLSPSSKVKVRNTELFLFRVQLNMSARGKRRGARKDSTAKKAKVTSESQSNVAVDEFEFQSTGKVKEPNRFVDFEAVLRASDIPLPLSSPQPPVQSVSHSTTTPIPDAVQIIPSVLGQSIEQLRCSGDEIFAHVPSSLRQQICNGEYINLALLLKGGMELQDFCEGGSLKLTSNGDIEMRAKVCKDKVPSIDKWTDAFLIYTSIYLTQYPDKAPQLLHYMFVIREAAVRQRGHCWCEYDEQFRIRQANNPSSWSVINNDLWWRCMQLPVPVSSSTTSAPTVFPASSSKSYTCFDFNKGVCHWPSPCKFPHTCSSCGSSSHGAVTCSGQSQTSMGQPFLRQAPFRGTFGRSGSRFQRGCYPRSAGAFGRGRARPY